MLKLQLFKNMKKSSLLFCLCVFTWLVFAADKEPAKAPAAAATKLSPLVGTWEHVTPEFRSIKFLTPTHFIWIRMDPKGKEITESIAGRYKHEGDTYTETLEFGTPAMKDFLGNDFGVYFR